MSIGHVSQALSIEVRVVGDTLAELTQAAEAKARKYSDALLHDVKIRLKDITEQGFSPYTKALDHKPKELTATALISIAPISSYGTGASVQGHDVTSIGGVPETYR